MILKSEWSRFSKKYLLKREVINDSDVEKVIAQIGTPEQIEEQEEAYYSEGKQNKSKSSTSYSSYSSNSKTTVP
jgi:hypothetical protein